MSRAHVRVRKLAREAEIDYEEAILLLWEANLIMVTGPDDYIPKNSLSRARRALGLHPSKIAVPVGPGKPEPAPTPRSGAGPVRASSATNQASSFDWTTIGTPSAILYLEPKDVLRIHEALVRDFARSGDPISPPGLRDRNLLESALFRPHTSLGDVLKYPSVPMAGAALFHSLALNHAFANGNKRTALVSLLVFLDANELFLEESEPNLFRYVLQVANHRVAIAGPELADRETHQIATWLNDHICSVSRGEKLLKFGELRQILNTYRCSVRILSGNRALISRTTNQVRWFRKRQVTLQSHIWYGDEGRDVERSTLKKVREELELDETHGIDSSRFYAARPGVDEFIAMYRKTLTRLARV